MTLGVANYYSSAYFEGSEGLGVLVKTREGRPIKIEANPDHPFSISGLSIRSQATLLKYVGDPERIQGPKRNLFNEKKSNSQVVDVKWGKTLIKSGGAVAKKADVVVLTGALASPATRAVVMVTSLKASKRNTWCGKPS